ncbi:hypothetical protein BDQ94DRAFT_142990 [Aspergillus welwitschiae]|uniref:Uncharacterized protein n=1 Tax=Aspergillus welwitschiae TaxID=1341132 RepID=A0A3F3Q4F3_9EURO|nr:hypothetical protein BDQ94DRAFT_142990 [Aspergillus welwitschiae]RDH33965.1 hypothetical protein BDQ94DRAFT_142990 [Aspergillus welwitschiae]
MRNKQDASRTGVGGYRRLEIEGDHIRVSGRAWKKSSIEFLDMTRFMRRKYGLMCDVRRVKSRSSAGYEDDRKGLIPSKGLSFP